MTRSQDQTTRDLARFLFGIARSAFGAAVTAVCLKCELTSIPISILFAVIVALTALRLEKRDTR